jgi:hypothetical protein
MKYLIICLTTLLMSFTSNTQTVEFWTVEPYSESEILIELLHEIDINKKDLDIQSISVKLTDDKVNRQVKFKIVIIGSDGAIKNFGESLKWFDRLRRV